MNVKITLSAFTFALPLLLASSCAGGDDAPTSTISSGDAGFEAYYGGGSIVPTVAMEGGAQGPGSYRYGSDGSSLSPCPREAAVDAGLDAASLETGPGDAPGGATCPGSLAPGDLVIEELMIASRSGGGDHGEWLEVMSTRDCAIDLKGLYAEVPHGKGATLASITTDVTLPPHGFFLIADSSDPAINNGLPGTVVTWGTGTSSDVLLNSGDTITLYTASVTVDTLTYPDPTKMIDGASMAFPSDCDPSLRTAFGNWQPSVYSWTPGYFGTPAAPNTDVSCPVAPPGPPSSNPCEG
jgi:hypothetical protein